MRRDTATVSGWFWSAANVAWLLLSGCSGAKDDVSGIAEPALDVTEPEPRTSVEFETAPADAATSFEPGVQSIRDVENAHSPPELISGLVGPGTGGGGISATHFEQSIVIDAWRDTNGDLIRRGLFLKRPLELVTDRTEYADEVPVFGIVEMLVQLNPERTRGVVLALSPAEPDADLLEYGAELRVPVVVQSSLGEFTLDRSNNYFYGFTDWGSNMVSLSLPARGDVLDPEVLSDAEALWSDQARWADDSLEFIVREMLELKNRAWLEDGESPLSSEQFKERVTLISISVDEGFLSFGFSDGDLFRGHDIYLTGTLQEGFTNAELFG